MDDNSLALCIIRLQESATAMIDVLHAVQYLHETGLVHRDLKAMTKFFVLRANLLSMNCLNL